GDTSTDPSGLRMEILVPPIASDTDSVMARPAVPVKVTDPFCPGVDVVTITDAPPRTIVAETSAGTLYNVNVIPPVFAATGSTRIEYVPETGNVRVSRNAPLGLTPVAASNAAPSRLRTETGEPAEMAWPVLPLGGRRLTA